MTETLTITGPEITATIAVLGAELVSLLEGDKEWLWQGDPLSWPGRAPILFPYIGRCAGNVLRHRGKEYPASKGHGFARDRAFQVVHAGTNMCRLRLLSDDKTRALYPFDFVLETVFTVERRTLTQRVHITNNSSEVMPVSIGFHSGFQWPLPVAAERGAEKLDHILQFDLDEPAPVRRLHNHLLSVNAVPSPISGRRLRLSEALFEVGAIVLDRVASRSVWFGIPGQSGIRVSHPDLPHLGLWMIPGADFLCIEPWQGHACPQDFDGELLEKPGMIHLAPGQALMRQMSVGVGVHASEALLPAGSE